VCAARPTEPDIYIYSRVSLASPDIERWANGLFV